MIPTEGIYRSCLHTPTTAPMDPTEELTIIASSQDESGKHGAWACGYSTTSGNNTRNQFPALTLWAPQRGIPKQQLGYDAIMYKYLCTLFFSTGSGTGI